MTWLIAMEYLCHKWPRICSTCRKHFQVLSSFMTYHRVCNSTCVTNGAGTDYPSGAPEFTSGYSIFSYMCMLCRSLLVLFYFFFWPLCCLFFCLLAIVLSVLLSFGHCVVCSSSIYGLWLPHWYRQTIYIYVEILNKFHLTKWFVEISTWQKKPGIFRHFMSLFRFLCNNFDFVCVCFSTCCFPVSRFIKF